jgi:hypothetical protein
MTQVSIGIQVRCSNDRCQTLAGTGNRRHIGMDGGLGGKWQCRICNKWTERAPVT